MWNDLRRSTVSQQTPTAQAHHSGKTFAAHKPARFQYRRSQDPLILRIENPIDTKNYTSCNPTLSQMIPSSNASPSASSTNPVVTENDMSYNLNDHGPKYSKRFVALKNTFL